jgi:hypothetical protein
MAVKKTTRRPSMKKKEPMKVTKLPDVFDEEASAKPIAPIAPVEDLEVEPTIVEPQPEELPSPRPPRIVTEVEEEQPETQSEPSETSVPEEKAPETTTELPTEPTFTVRQNGQTVEQKLPSFFVGESDDKVSEADPIAELPTEPQSQETQVLESVVPQAFVGEVREVAREAKRERKGALVTVFIIIGMILVAGGVLGLFVMSTRKQGGNQPTPQPSAEVMATPEPTPTIIVNTATSSATASVSAEIKKEVKVNVLNGTAIKGLANKQAAILRENDFVVGTVGNGDPTKAGTIVVPEGRLDLGEEIKTLLTEFSFTVSEDSTVKAITVTLGEPQE